jgi:hypothetical protein
VKAATLQKIEDEIEAGDYGKARDRLHGLLVTYPDDLSIRRRLGDVCWQLQHPAMAGRYWYLEADQTPERLCPVADASRTQVSWGHRAHP